MVAYKAGVTAANEKRWQDSEDAFVEACDMADTDKEKEYSRNWVIYVSDINLKALSGYMQANH